MKTQDIRRGITSRHYRTEGCTPGIGTISRLRNPELPAHEGRRGRRRSRYHRNAKPSGTIWLLLLGAGTLVVITAAVFLWLKPRFDATEAAFAHAVPEDTRTVRIASRFPSPSREETMEFVKRALATRDPDDVPGLFRIKDSTPDEVVTFLEETERREGPLEKYEWLSSLDKDGLLIEGVIVTSSGTETPVSRLALLTPDEAGNWKVDFEAWARIVEPGWHELLGDGSAQAVVRVTVAPDVYYNGPFSDDRQWVSYGLSSPDVSEKLRGYCRVGSVQAEAMARLFMHDEKNSRATIEIRRVPGTDPKQFEIIRVLGGEWVVAGNR